MLTAMSFSEDNGLMLTARYAEDGEQPVSVGARFILQVEETSESKGVLEVVIHDPDVRLVHMSCVQEDAAAYWKALATRAVEDPSPPPKVRLVATTVEELPFLQLDEAESRAEVSTDG